MLRRMDGARLIKPIPFSQLPFRIPYTELWICDNKTTVFFNGVAKKSGVVILKYTIAGKQYLKISCAATDMYSNALMLQKFMKKIGAENVQYAFIHRKPEFLEGVAKSVWLGYLNEPLDDSFQMIKPWIEDPTSNDFPLQQLRFEEPFSKDDKGNRRWNFYHYRQRIGVYLIKEDDMIVRVGKSVNHLDRRPRSYFYPVYSDRPTKHTRVSYYDKMEQHTYTLSIIEVPASEFKSWKALEKAVEKLEARLISHFIPRNNLKGNEGAEWFDEGERFGFHDANKSSEEVPF